MRRTPLCLAVLVAACGGKQTPPPPGPPQVTISVPSSVVVDVSVQVNADVSGCNAVTSIQIFDHDQFVTTVGGGAHVTGQIGMNQVPYGVDGLAANMSLTAKATCDDGRSNTSQPVGVLFLPVQQVYSNSNGGQYVPDVFYAEGSGGTVTFVGCSQQTNGTTALVRVNLSGAVVASNLSLPFPCNDAASYTDKGPNGMRWMLQPGAGAMAFDTSLHTLAFVMGNLQNLAMGPDGDAVIYNGMNVYRISATTSGVVWNFAPLGSLTGNPIVRTGFGVSIPEYIDQLGNDQGTVSIEAVDYTNGVKSAQYDLATITYGLGGLPAIPPTYFNVDGSVIYVPYQTPAGGSSTVIACATTASNCQMAPNQRWASPSLLGNIALAMPFDTYSRIAAVGPQFSWFLDASSGQLINANPVHPTGSLITESVQAGLGTDFYLLNGSGQTLPTEIVAIDDPANGEVFRFDQPAGTVTVAVDDSGQPWLRLGANLVEPLPLAQYRMVHP